MTTFSYKAIALFRIGKVWPSVDLFVTNHWTPIFSISISKQKWIFVRSILEFQNDTKVTAPLKLHTLEVGLAVHKYP